jgi:hypothetical protein
MTASLAAHSAAPGLPSGLVYRGQHPTGGGFIGSGDQHANALQLQLRLLPSGVIGGGECPQAVTAEQADDQFRLGPAADNRD